MQKKEALAELKSVSGKSLSECLRAYNEANNVGQAFVLLFRNEIETIKSRTHIIDEDLITKSLIITQNNIEGALSLLTHGYDCFSIAKTIYPEFSRYTDSVKYDDASWHNGEKGVTHIGMFLAWCIDRDLISEKLKAEAEEDIQQVRDRAITGAELLISICDGKLADIDLNEAGNRFAKDYFQDHTDFGNRYGSYIDDYSKTFDKNAEENGFEYESIYHVENSFENYDLLKPVIDNKFTEWKTYTNFQTDEHDAD